MAIRLGTLLPGSIPVGIGVNKARRGFAWMHDSSQQCVIVKSVAPANLAAEIFCAALGRAADLPIPEPIVVRDPGKNSLLFGSIFHDYPNLHQAFRIDVESDASVQIALVIARVIQWTRVGDIMGFDEWINNVDRNLQNILWDGFDDFLLIDHGLSLGLASCPPPEDNKLLYHAILTLSSNSDAIDELKKKVLMAAVKFEPAFAEDAARVLSSVPHQDASKNVNNFLNFVVTRLPQLAAMLAKRFPTAQLNLDL